MNIDLLSMSAHKMYGPKGIGALYVRAKGPRVRVTPIIDGGGHERGFRSGTLNVPGIVGFGKACDLCREGMADEAQRLLGLRERLREGLFSQLDEIFLNGHPVHRLPGNLNVSFAYVEGESLLMGLNGSTHPIAVAESQPPIAVSSGSASGASTRRRRSTTSWTASFTRCGGCASSRRSTRWRRKASISSPWPGSE